MRTAQSIKDRSKRQRDKVANAIAGCAFVKEDSLALHALVNHATLAIEPCCERDLDGDGSCPIHPAKDLLEIWEGK